MRSNGIRIGAYAFHVEGSSDSRPWSTKEPPTNSSEAGDSIDGPVMRANTHPASAPVRHEIEPNRITVPRSAPTNATAANGPGVGGTMAWVSCMAPTSPVDITLMFTPV